MPRFRAPGGACRRACGPTVRTYRNGESAQGVGRDVDLHRQGEVIGERGWYGFHGTSLQATADQMWSMARSGRQLGKVGTMQPGGCSRVFWYSTCISGRSAGS